MLVKWSPYNEMERSFDDFFGRDRFNRPLWDVRPLWDETGDVTTASWRPAVNIYEDDNALHIEAQLPGIDMKDVNLSVTDHTLELSGERKMEHEDKKAGYLFKEARYGSFSRSFSLPSYLDPSKATARYDRGVLTVTVPKGEQAKPKVIPIEAK